MNHPAKLLSATLVTIVLSGCTAIPRHFVNTDQSRRTGPLVEGDPMYRITPPGAIAAIDDPKWVDVDTAGPVMQPHEAVIVYQQDGETRIYSTWTLNAHEIVNDHVGETPIAVTW